MESVEIVLGWEESFGIRLPDEEVGRLRTPGESVELIVGKLGAVDAPRVVCLTLRAFGRLRRAVVECLGVERRGVRPETRLKQLFKRQPKDTWEQVRAASGLTGLPAPSFTGFFLPLTVGDWMTWAVTHAAKDLKPAGEPWTRAEVRQVVREVITEILGVKGFGDDDDFVRDIGMS